MPAVNGISGGERIGQIGHPSEASVISPTGEDSPSVRAGGIRFHAGSGSPGSDTDRTDGPRAHRVGGWMPRGLPVPSRQRIPIDKHGAARYHRGVVHSRLLNILLTAILALNAIVGGAGGVAVLCLGGGHEHAQAESEHCQSACVHDSEWPLPVSSRAHGDGCGGCTDFEFAVAELLAIPPSDDQVATVPTISAALPWRVGVTEPGVGRRGPPAAWLGIDPSGERRLAMVASVRLIL